MSDQTATPDSGATPAAPMTTEDALVGLFERELALENEPPAPAEPSEDDTDSEAPPALTENSEADAVEAGAEEEAAEDDTDPDSEPDQQAIAPAIEPPSGMSEADKAVFAKLSPEMQTWVSQRDAARTADYTRKTQEAAEIRKDAQARVDVLAQAMQQYDNVLAQFTGHQPSPPDPALKEQDPFAFDEAWRDYQVAKERYDLAQRERAANAERYKNLQTTRMQEFYQEQAKRLSELSPELADQSEKGATLRRGVYDYAQRHGYTAEQLELATAQDMVTLLKAMRYDATVAARKHVTPKNQPLTTAQPGKAKGTGRPSNLQRSVQALKANPSVDTLEAAYLADLQSEKR